MDRGERRVREHMPSQDEIRKRIEQWEFEYLAPQAAKSSQTKGREHEGKQECGIRTDFQRDRDRIIHSKAFRRLKHKTQVFLAPEGDHYRTRLTHTLEVSQISRTIARALCLNEDLTEAIALGHDLGHTPFGHVGEEAISRSLGRSFSHNEQSLRVVTLLEYDGRGLNLTHEVRDGILNHTGSVQPETLEGQIVKLADRIAYLNHDIDDAVRAKIIGDDELPDFVSNSLGRYQSERINTMVVDLINHSSDLDEIRMGPEIGTLMSKLREFMFERVYLNSVAKSENNKAIGVLTSLFKYFIDHPSELPKEHSIVFDPLETRVVDYLAGMTDHFAIKTFEQLFIPRAWILT